MHRVSAIALLTCAPLLFTQSALAQDCFCGAGPWQVAPTFGLVEVAPEALIDGPDALVAPETPDTTIESSVSATATAAAVPVAPVVLWCTSGNDPRCMPMHPSDTPGFRALGGGPVAVGVELARAPLARVARAMISMTPAEGLAPARGVVTSIERPPRG